MSFEIECTIAYVLSSTYRLKVVKVLHENMSFPTKIANNAGIRPNHISKVLKDLKDNNIVECINPEVRKGKLYRLTDKGEKISELIFDRGSYK